MKREAGIRKAAILVSSLDRETARLMLRQLGTADAGQVCQMMARLGAVDPTERREVLEEFLRLGPSARAALEPRRSWQGPSVPTTPSSPAKAGENGPFAFLQSNPVEDVIGLLARERAQTVALVLAHLPRERAGQILRGLDAPLQTDVLRRLAELEETEPDIIREVEQVLQQRLAESTRFQRRRALNADALADLLAPPAAPMAPEPMIEASHDHVPPPEPIEFDEFPRFDDATLGLVFRAAEPELVALALMGAEPSLIGRVLRQLPPRQAQWTERQLQSPGPMRLSDVEDARIELASLARRLDAHGPARRRVA